MSRMPDAVPQLSRRHVLVATATLAVLGTTASACGTKQPPKVDELVAQLELARRDSQLAGSAAMDAGPFYAPLLNVVADERKMHASALSDEITRARGTAVASTTSSAAPSAEVLPAPSRTDVIAAVRESADSATKLAAELSGYRAGLLGSIAAACTASATFSLVLKEPAR
ncbi:MAG: hypothetical protein QOH57_4649 [Mycobacterium sp.]|jgi:hypothetical protein|nr:hypothetical protein [Mycobacterium sp.]